MKFYRRLRWRLIAAPIIVAVIGTGSMMVTTFVIASHLAPDFLSRELQFLIQNPLQIETTQAVLLEGFQRALIRSVAIAALAALLGGTVYSFILWRSLVVPLREIAASSQRIAGGRYVERVKMPRQNLGVALTQLIINFNQMAESLASVEEQRIVLLGNVTHELRTPLTSLKGYLEGLQDGLFEPDEETFAVLEQEVDRLSRLVEDLQTMATVEAGGIELARDPVDLDPVFKQILVKFYPLAKEKNIGLKSHNRMRPSTHVVADRDRIIQILTNLVGNAFRYTPDGGEISITARECDDFPGSRVAIEVKDSGIGISAEALPYVFERFYRVDPSRSRGSGGSGVGLTIARHLAWQMEGDLTAESPGAGQGSTFRLVLPRGVRG